MRLPLPGVTMVALGGLDAGFAVFQGGDLPTGIAQWLTAVGFFVVGGWAIKDHIALRKEKVKEVQDKAVADKVLADELQSIRDEHREMHAENRRRFDKIDGQIKGDETYPGLLYGDRRDSKRRHFLMNQFAAAVGCFLEANKQVGRLSDAVKLDYEDGLRISEDLREVIKRLSDPDAPE